MVVKAGSGDDIAVGGAGGDELYGGKGLDVLIADGFGASFTGPALKSFAEKLRDKKIQLAGVEFGPEGSESNQLFGEEDFDVLIGSAGGDQLEAGPGGSIMLADAFTASASLSFDFSSFLDDPGPDSARSLLELGLQFEAETGLPAGGSPNTVRGGTGFDLVLGGDGTDTIYSGGGVADVIFGFGGNDTVVASAFVFAPLDQQAATDFSIIFGGEATDTITGGIRSLVVGGGGNDTITGGEGFDVLLGDSFTFSLNGQEIIDGFADFLHDLEDGKFAFRVGVHAAGAGSDTIHGNGFADILIGGDGDDTLYGGTGWNLIFGDSFDLVLGPEDPEEPQPVEIAIGDFLNGDDDSGDPNQDDEAEQNRKKSKIKGVWEKVLAIIGTPEFELKGTGTDTIDGGDGIDVILGGEGNDTVRGGGGFADVLIGNDGQDTLKAHDSFFSLMIGGEGNDTLEASTVGGSLGSILIGDSLEFLGIPVNFASLFVYEFDGLFPKRLGIQGGLVQAGTGDDTLKSAKDGFNFVVGGNGDDTLYGFGFFDFLLADSYNIGTNLLIDFTGLSSDKSLSENYEAIQTAFELPGSAGNGQDTIHAAGEFTIAIGGANHDTINGGPGALDLLFGGDGPDTLTGGEGFNIAFLDSVDFAGGPFNFIEQFSEFTQEVIFGDPNLTLNTIASVFGFTGDGDDDYVGGGSFDIVFGGGGDDVIDGGGSGLLEFDFLVGGFGDDTLNGSGGNDVVFGGPGQDTLFGGPGNDHLESEEGNDLFYGGPGDDKIFGGFGNDLIYGDEDNDELHGETGEDSLFGSLGDDVLYGGPGLDLLDGGEGTNTLFQDDPLEAVSGGPYSVVAGASVLLDRAYATLAGAYVYSWDFDTDGNFGEPATLFGDESGLTPAFNAAALTPGAVIPVAFRVFDGVTHVTAGTTLNVISPSSVLIVDNLNPQFATAGDWALAGGDAIAPSYQNTVHAAYGETFLPADAATWTFTLPGPGRYRLAATWFTNTMFPTFFSAAAPFEVKDGSTVLGTVLINQQLLPNDFPDTGVEWEEMGAFDVFSGTLYITLRTAADNTGVIADAIRVEKIADLSPGPEIVVTLGGVSGLNMPDDTGHVNFGTTDFNRPVTKTFTISNQGSLPLSVGPPSMNPVSVAGDAAFTMVWQPGLSVLNPGRSTTFQVQMSGATPGIHTATVSFGNNEGNENPYSFAVSGIVLPTRIIDDGDLEFAMFPLPGEPGGWGQIGGPGRGFDYKYNRHIAGVDEFATWTFNVTPGVYRVSTTWAFGFAGFDDAAPFTIFDGPVAGGIVRGGRNVDQKVDPAGTDYPAGFMFPLGTASSTRWERIDVVHITGDTLTVLFTGR